MRYTEFKSTVGSSHSIFLDENLLFVTSRLCYCEWMADSLRNLQASIKWTKSDNRTEKVASLRSSE